MRIQAGDKLIANIFEEDFGVVCFVIFANGQSKLLENLEETTQKLRKIKRWIKMEFKV